MLKTLYIGNVALIDEAEISFSEGLNVLSGETGSGKSVILDCIDFVLGAKADKGMIRFGQEECSVRAEFSCEDPAVLSLLDEMDLERDETLVLSRRLNREGKGGAKINGCPVTSSMLRRLTSHLVDVHGQSEHFFLIKESNQLRLLDRIAGEEAEEKKAELKALLVQRRESEAQLASLGGDEGARERRLDILRFQIAELGRAELKEGEEEELSLLRTKYANAEKIAEGLETARDALRSDGCGIDCVGGAQRALSAILRYGEYASYAERLQDARAELSDIAESLDGCLAELEIDEAEREHVETRLDEIRALKKKYGGTVAEALSYLKKAEAECEMLENSGEVCEHCKAEITRCNRKLYEASLALREIRMRAAEGFTQSVTEELRTLNIPSARFEVQFDDFSESDADRATETGMGGARFLFSANAGEPPKELSKIISGGEMSRFMLAIKARLSSYGSIGTYIFDEIDAGIGGRTARVVAEKFCAIARSTQIIAVSHLAQIAAYADRQFLIEKGEREGRTHTKIREVSGEERQRELARLIAGGETELSLRHADELLRQAEEEKSLWDRDGK